jgi:hypothetical protein
MKKPGWLPGLFWWSRYSLVTGDLIAFDRFAAFKISDG